MHTDDLKVLGVITARGGSKGVPRKNLRMLAGKPLVVHTILAALSVRELFHRIVVSTDDPEIAEICSENGAEVPFMRPDELARDETPSLPVIQHAIRFIEEQDGMGMDWAMILQPTSPLRLGEDIAAAVRLAGTGKYDSVVSVRLSNSSHPLKMKRIDEDGLLRSFIDGAVEPSRRQELRPDAYQRNGAVYLSRRAVLMDEGRLYGERICPLVMPAERSVDIDSEIDFRIAEVLIRELTGRSA